MPRMNAMLRMLGPDEFEKNTSNKVVARFFLGGLSDLFQGLLVTSIWVISSGHGLKKLVDDYTPPKKLTY